MLSPHPVPTSTVQETAAWQAPPSASMPSGTQKRIESSTLLQGGRELLIAHAGAEYRLRLTRNDKLILTK